MPLEVQLPQSSHLLVTNMKKRIQQFILLLGVVFVSLFSLFPFTAQAQSDRLVSERQAFANAYTLFPGESIGDFRIYIRNFYFFSIGAAMLVAVILMMVGGVIWLTSAGNQGRVTKGKEFIINSLIGVILLISAYLILQVINPSLVNLDSADLPKIPGTGSCVIPAKLPNGTNIVTSIDGADALCRQFNEIDCIAWATVVTQGSANPTHTKNSTCDEACFRYADGDGACVLTQRKITINLPTGATLSQAIQRDLARLAAQIPDTAREVATQTASNTAADITRGLGGDATDEAIARSIATFGVFAGEQAIRQGAETVRDSVISSLSPGLFAAQRIYNTFLSD